MTQTLCAAHRFLTADNLRDFDEAGSNLENTDTFPEDIKYFRNIKALFSEIKKIRDELRKIKIIERFETRRERLSEQKQEIETLSSFVEKTFYEPFMAIWKKILTSSADILDREIHMQQSSASISIELKNKEIRASQEERHFYFLINNEGQEMAEDISVKIAADDPKLLLCGDTQIQIELMESGKSKEFFFPVMAESPLNTNIRGKVIFSDRARVNKEVPFSFPIAVIKEVEVFHRIENPYVAGPALRRDSDLFFGRKDAIDFINNNITTKDSHHTIVCYGLRRTGKSSLLYKLEKEGFNDKRLIPIYFDMQGVDNEKHFYKSLSKALLQKMNITNNDLPQDFGFGEFTELLEQMKRDLGEKIFVLMIDEFEELQMRVEKGKIAKSIFSNIRNLMQHEEKLIFLFCGTHKLEDMKADYWSIFFNTATYHKVSYLSSKDTQDLIRKPVEGMMTYDDLAVEQILKMTNGQPYLTQLICRTLVNDLNEKEKNYASIDDVDDAVDNIVSQGDDHFSAYIWQQANILERLILSVLAEELSHKQLDSMNFDAIFDTLGTVSRKFLRDECIEALKNLVSKDILMARNLNYSFPMNFLRKWLVFRHPLQQTREEI